MRVLRPIINVVLVVSILINVVLIYKIRGKRAIISVNGSPITRTDMHDYLTQEYGPQYKAAMVHRLLVDQEAHQQLVAPTDEDIQEELDARRELDWSFAQQLSRQPWRVDEAKAELKLGYEEQHLRAKDIPVTDEEVREEYQQNTQVYDTPNKARCAVAAVMADSRTDEIKRMLMSSTPPYSPAAISANYPREVVFLGEDNRFTFAQPYGSTYNAHVFSMEPRQVLVEQAPIDLAQRGAKKLIIRLEEIVPGHRADLSDPKIVKKIKLHIALKRAKPVNELLDELWNKATLVFDDPADKSNVEMLLFPEKAKSQPR